MSIPRIIDELRYTLDSNGCWNYKMYIARTGYGQVTINKKPVLAHRYFYEKY